MSPEVVLTWRQKDKSTPPPQTIKPRFSGQAHSVVTLLTYVHTFILT